jgi:F-type H+-transporting ATPase subunit c
MHMSLLLLFAAIEPGGSAAGGSLLGGNLHVGLGALGAAIGVGWIGASASSAVGRNPGASTKVLVQSILAIAFAEAIVFYTLFLVK